MKTMATFDFARGDPSIVPTVEMRKVLLALAKEDTKPTSAGEETLAGCLSYGDEVGGAAFLSELASFLERNTDDDDFGDVADEKKQKDASGHQTPDAIDDAVVINTVFSPKEHGDNKLFITTGVSHGIELLVSNFVR